MLLSASHRGTVSKAASSFFRNIAMLSVGVSHGSVSCSLTSLLLTFVISNPEGQKHLRNGSKPRDSMAF